MAEYAVMPYTDYEDACEAVREKTGGTEVIKSGDLGDQIRAIESGGASIETCTVTVSHPTQSEVKHIGYTTVEDGVITPKVVSLTALVESVTFDAIVGSCVSIINPYTDLGLTTNCVTNGTVLKTQTEWTSGENSAYIIALPSSGDCTITLS